MCVSIPLHFDVHEYNTRRGRFRRGFLLALPVSVYSRARWIVLHLLPSERVVSRNNNGSRERQHPQYAISNSEFACKRECLDKVPRLFSVSILASKMIAICDVTGWIANEGCERSAEDVLVFSWVG